VACWRGRDQLSVRTAGHVSTEEIEKQGRHKRHQGTVRFLKKEKGPPERQNRKSAKGVGVWGLNGHLQKESPASRGNTTAPRSWPKTSIGWKRAKGGENRLKKKA